jgi:LytS/YehU family sensor histidine kinase
MDDRHRAVTFVNELSSVYRYLLQANDEDLTTLQKELAFLAHYFHLLKTRFGEGIEWETAIAERYLGSRLPPLTLQLLVENAVKHNAVLPNKPLQIRLFTDEPGNLVITNNLQKKNTTALSHKKGLQNILSKYRLLHQQQVIIQQTTDTFQVTIPLIQPDVYETLDRGR